MKVNYGKKEVQKVLLCYVVNVKMIILQLLTVLANPVVRLTNRGTNLVNGAMKRYPKMVEEKCNNNEGKKRKRGTSSINESPMTQQEVRDRPQLATGE